MTDRHPVTARRHGKIAFSILCRSLLIATSIRSAILRTFIGHCMQMTDWQSQWQQWQSGGRMVAFNETTAWTSDRQWSTTTNCGQLFICVEWPLELIGNSKVIRVYVFDYIVETMTNDDMRVKLWFVGDHFICDRESNYNWIGQGKWVRPRKREKVNHVELIELFKGRDRVIDAV